MSEVQLVRHGESRFNEFDIDNTSATNLPKDVTLDSNAPLTPIGEEQAYQLGERMAEMLSGKSANLITVFVSDFKRAVDTAKIVLARVNENRAEGDRLTIQTPDPRLPDQHLGLTEPLYVNRYPKQLAGVYDDYWLRRNSQGGQGRIFEKPINSMTPELEQIAVELGLHKQSLIVGENLRDVMTRLQSWFDSREVQRVIVGQPNSKSLVFCHGGIHYASRAVFLGESPERVAEFINRPEALVGNCKRSIYTNTGQIGNKLEWALRDWAIE